MNEEKEPVVPVPAGVLAALEAVCTFTDCKTINHHEMLEIISDCAEEVEEGLSGTISMLSLAYVIFETEKTHGEKAAKLEDFKARKKNSLHDLSLIPLSILKKCIGVMNMNEKELLIALRLTQHNHRILMKMKNKQLEAKK